MKGLFSAALILLTDPSALPASTIAQWDFNSPTPDGDVTTGATVPVIGNGHATPIGGTVSSFVTGDTRLDPAGSADNSSWRTAKYPAIASSNKCAGVRFDIDTTGYDTIVLGWSQQNSATASRYERLQYTLDGGNFTDADVIVIQAESVFTNQTVSLAAIPGAANNPLFGFQIVAEWESTATGSGLDEYVATKPGSTYGVSGAIRFDMVSVAGTSIPGVNTAPTISGIPDQILRPNQSTGTLPVTVGDAEDSASALILTEASSEPSVIADANVALGGSGNDRTVSVTAGSQSGRTLINLWVTDTGGRSASTSFSVMVLPADTPPIISDIARTNTLVDTPTPPIAFVIGDGETPADQLCLAVCSFNPVLVPESQIVLGGSGSNRTVTITPAPGQWGVAPISITVSDGANTASSVFPLLVTASPMVSLCDPFTYANGSVRTNSGFLWATRSGTVGQCQVRDGHLQLCATQSEDVVAPLIGAPYAKTNSTALYASFKFNFQSLPKPMPGLFAHFADGSTLRGRIYVGTTNAAAGCFRLQVANGAQNPIELAVDLTTNTTYTAVTRYVIDTAITTVWLNPASEAEPGVSAEDPQTAVPIASYGFRQDSDLGADLWIDDLVVGHSFSILKPDASLNVVPLTWQFDGLNLWLTWTDPACVLQTATDVDGFYADVPSAVSPYNESIGGGARFFRLRSPQ